MNFISKTLTYLKASRQELSKVVWPTKKELIKYTLSVLAISLLMMLFLYVSDLIFDYLINLTV